MKNLRIAVINSELGLDIDQSSSVEDIINCDYVEFYPITDYFQAQNDEELPTHWSFLIDIEKKINLTGTNIEGIHMDTKASKITVIKRIIEKWGETTPTELELDSSPCISSKGSDENNISELIEKFGKNSVQVVLYHNQTVIIENEINYELLNEDIINQIHDIITNYDEDQHVEYN